MAFPSIQLFFNGVVLFFPHQVEPSAHPGPVLKNFRSKSFLLKIIVSPLAIANVNDPKAWCYTVDSNKRWEYCSPRCTGSASSTDATPITDASSTDAKYEIFRAPTPIHPSTGTRFRDVPEQIPQIDARSQYDQNGKCLKNCKSRSYSYKIFGESSTHLDDSETILLFVLVSLLRLSFKILYCDL